MKLSELKKGRRAIVVELNLQQDDPTLFRRLLLMGIRPGTQLEMVGKAPLGDPIVVRVNNQGFGLRRELTEKIEVRPCE